MTERIKGLNLSTNYSYIHIFWFPSPFVFWNYLQASRIFSNSRLIVVRIAGIIFPYRIPIGTEIEKKKKLSAKAMKRTYPPRRNGWLSVRPRRLEDLTNESNPRHLLFYEALEGFFGAIRVFIKISYSLSGSSLEERAPAWLIVVGVEVLIVIFYSNRRVAGRRSFAREISFSTKHFVHDFLASPPFLESADQTKCKISMVIHLCSLIRLLYSL